MNHEIQELIDLVKTTTEPVQTVVERFFSEIEWSLLKDEWNRMNKTERRFLIAKLSTERK